VSLDDAFASRPIAMGSLTDLVAQHATAYDASSTVSSSGRAAMVVGIAGRGAAFLSEAHIAARASDEERERPSSVAETSACRPERK
jgi:hypothetical protein